MQNFYRQFKWKENFRRLFAVAFLFCLLAEWGSHGLAFAHKYSGDGLAAQSQQDEHEDLCKTLMRCSDGPRREQPAANFGHEFAQHNAFFDRFADTSRPAGYRKDPRIDRAKIRALFRPVSPPFHPPELS